MTNGLWLALCILSRATLVSRHKQAGGMDSPARRLASFRRKRDSQAARGRAAGEHAASAQELPLRGLARPARQPQRFSGPLADWSFQKGILDRTLCGTTPVLRQLGPFGLVRNSSVPRSWPRRFSVQPTECHAPPQGPLMRACTRSAPKPGWTQGGAWDHRPCLAPQRARLRHRNDRKRGRLVLPAQPRLHLLPSPSLLRQPCCDASRSWFAGSTPASASLLTESRSPRHWPRPRPTASSSAAWQSRSSPTWARTEPCWPRQPVQTEGICGRCWHDR